MPVAGFSTCVIGTYSYLTKSFSTTLDLNDRATYYVDAITPAKFSRVRVSNFNIRSVGEPIYREQKKNRDIVVTLYIKAASSAALDSALTTLLQAVEGQLPTTPYVLELKRPNGSTTKYSTVLAVDHDIPADAREYISGIVGGKKRITLTFHCYPYAFGATQVLANAATNPGFEAPSGPGVTVFNDSLATLNAYDPQQYTAAVLADSPIRYYEMDEVSGTTATDFGSQHVNGTYTGSPTLGVAGPQGGADSAVTLNGTTQYMALPTTSLPTGNVSVTLEALVKIAANPGATATVVHLGNGHTSGAYLELDISNTGTVTLTSGAATSPASSALSLGVWHHLAGVYDGAKLHVYVDGTEAGTGTAYTTLALAYGTASVGCYGAGTGQFLAASVDEAAIYSAALSAARISAHSAANVALTQDKYTYADTVLADLPLRYYRLDETAGTTAYEAVSLGGSNNGTYQASPTLGVTGALAGDSDTAITVNGSTQYVSAGATGLPSGNAAWSVEAWVKLPSTPAVFVSVVRWGTNGTNTAVDFGFTNTGKPYAGFASGSITTATNALTNNAWHQMVATYDGTNLNLYADGSLVAGPTVATAGAVGTTGMAIGALVGGGNYFNGSIDEVAIYSTTLSAARVTAHYNAGHNTPAAQSNTALIPAGGRVVFGSPAWGAINTWQTRFRWVTGLTATFYLHYTDANNSLAAVVSPTALALNQTVAGVVNTLATHAITPVNGRQLWLQITQFPSVSGNPPYCQAALLVDNAGAIGGGISVGAATHDAVTALIGQPQLAASGGALGLGGNYTSVHTLSLFGPGGWSFTPQQNAATGLAVGAWDTTWGNPTVTSPTTYPSGPVTSFGAARLDLTLAGTIDGLLQLYTGGTPAGTSAIPVQTATNVLGYSVYVKETGLNAAATVAVVITEYNAAGSATGSASGNLGALTGGALPTSWTKISGSYTTHANCAYVDFAVRVVDTAVAGESGGATVWVDNAQVWDQTRTGMATMPYCELRFPQSPAQLMVSGLLGDVAATASLMMGVYCTAFNTNQTYKLLIGRRAKATAGWQGINAKVVSNLPTTFVLDSTSWGGYYVTINYGLDIWPTISATVASQAGTYHLLDRMWSNNGNPTGLAQRIRNDLYLAQSYNVLGTNKIVEQYSSNVNSLTTASAWQLGDAGQCVVPPVPLGAQADPTTIYSTLFFESSGGSGGDTMRFNWAAMMPIDAEYYGATLINASNALYNVTAQWLYTYCDGRVAGAANSYSVETAPIPAPGHAAGIYGTAGTGSISVNPAADVLPQLDPTQTVGSASVNQYLLIGVDNNNGPLPCAVEIVYSPQYLFPL